MVRQTIFDGVTFLSCWFKMKDLGTSKDLEIFYIDTKINDDPFCFNLVSRFYIFEN
jgi:hypothetical protein